MKDAASQTKGLEARIKALDAKAEQVATKRAEAARQLEELKAGNAGQPAAAPKKASRRGRK